MHRLCCVWRHTDGAVKWVPAPGGTAKIGAGLCGAECWMASSATKRRWDGMNVGPPLGNTPWSTGDGPNEACEAFAAGYGGKGRYFQHADTNCYVVSGALLSLPFWSGHYGGFSNRVLFHFRFPLCIPFVQYGEGAGGSGACGLAGLGCWVAKDA